VQVIFPPIDLAYLAAAAEASGATVRIVDYPAEGGGWEHFIYNLNDFKPDLLIFDVTTATLEKDLWVCRIAREIHPPILTAAKGDYLSVFGKDVLAKHNELDLVLVGESEATVMELVKDGPVSPVDGIIYRTSDGNVVETNPRPLIEDLDTLPFPARHLLENDLYRSPETGNKLTVIHANRGCPAKCIFCPAGRMSGFTLRSRSPENVVNEIEECVNKYGIDEFLLHGDTFTMKKSWVIKLCQLIVESGLNIRWGCNSRVDTFDLERAEWLKKAGCWVVAFGVESGSQLLLDNMKKGTKVEQAIEAVKICKKTGLRAHAFFLIGLPWETQKTLEETYNLALKLNTDFFDINIAYPLPGTEFYEIAQREELIISPDALQEGSYGRAAVRTYELSPDELTEWRRKALMRLYLRPRYIINTLSFAARSPNVLKHYISSGFRRFRNLLFG